MNIMYFTIHKNFGLNNYKFFVKHFAILYLIHNCEISFESWQLRGFGHKNNDLSSFVWKKFSLHLYFVLIIR